MHPALAAEHCWRLSTWDILVKDARYTGQIRNTYWSNTAGQSSPVALARRRPRWRWRGLRSRVAGRSGEAVERGKSNGKVDSDGSHPKRTRKIAVPTE